MTNTTRSLSETGCTRPSTIHDMRNGRCVGCGAVESVESVEKFDRILDLEDAVRIGTAVRACVKAGTPDFVKDQQAQSRDSDKARLMDAIAALSVEEMAAFGEYRKAARA